MKSKIDMEAAFFFFFFFWRPCLSFHRHINFLFHTACLYMLITKAQAQSEAKRIISFSRVVLFAPHVGHRVYLLLYTRKREHLIYIINIELFKLNSLLK